MKHILYLTPRALLSLGAPFLPCYSFLDSFVDPSCLFNLSRSELPRLPPMNTFLSLPRLPLEVISASFNICIYHLWGENFQMWLTLHSAFKIQPNHFSSPSNTIIISSCLDFCNNNRVHSCPLIIDFSSSSESNLFKTWGRKKKNHCFLPLPSCGYLSHSENQSLH